MADQQEKRAALCRLLAERIPTDAGIILTHVQVDALFNAGYINERLLAGLQREDLPDSTFLPAVRNLLLQVFTTQAVSVSQWMQQELAPYVASLPTPQPAFEELAALLRSRPFKLPCGSQAIQALTLQAPMFAVQLETFGLDIDGYFGHLISEVPQVIGSELKTVIAFEGMMSGVWASLKAHAPSSLRLDYNHDADTAIQQRSTAVSLLYNCRPDSHVIIDQRLCMANEYKALELGVKQAQADLRRKSVRLLQSHYGSVQYIPAFAAAGYTITFHVITTDGGVKDLGVSLDLQLAKDRAQLLFIFIHLYCLLLGVSQALPPLHNLLPQNQWIQRLHAEIMWSTPADPTKERFLKKVTHAQHRALLDSLGISIDDNLTMCAIGTTNNGLVACNQVALRGSIMLSMPVLGPDLATNPPVTEQEFVAAARSIAKGLHSLHSQHGVFLDVRAANICWRTNTARDEAVMVDMSTCGKAGCKPTIMLTDWDSNGPNRTLNRAGHYTKDSDMRQFTVMLRKFCIGRQWSSNCTAFCDELAARRLTAAQALQHSYLQS